jgi:ATPase subunit of ABC transporter with duplicated ATPase domains
MLSTNNLGKSYGARTLFSGVSLKLNPGSRYGLVGANGSGKTTFLNVLTGDEPATEGTVTIPKRARVGVLRQDRFLSDDELIVDVAARGDLPVWEALSELKKIEEGHGDPTRAAELDELVRVNDGYTLEARASHVLAGLGIAAALHRQPLAVLSGGFKLRVLLAQALLGGADVLLLDEPTNHLDILSIRWLEKFLAGYRGCAVVISHDQRFLDNVATHVIDVDYGTLTIFSGNYTTFAAEKASIRARKEAEIARTEATIAHKQAYVDRFRFKASKAAQAQSILKQIEKIEVDELAETSRREPLFSFVPARPSGRDVLEIQHVNKSYGEKSVLRDVSLVVRRGERLGVIGPNGLGKSTLLRIAVDATQPDAGTVRWGHEVRVGYFAQDHREVLLDPEARAIEVIQDVIPDAAISVVRGTLGRVLFSGEDAYKRVSSLSGGEAARLVFGRIMAEHPNVLVLDEPTNHLDLEAIDALVKALKTYEGTLLFVSHDRRFVSDVATRILEITPEGPRDFPGTYEEYLARCGDDHLDAESVVLRAKRERSANEPAAPGAPATLSWEEQKKKRNRAQQLPAKRDRAMAAVEAAEKRLADIHTLYASDGFFEKTPKPQLDALVAEEAALGPRILELMAEWEALEAECAALAEA